MNCIIMIWNSSKKKLRRYNRKNKYYSKIMKKNYRWLKNNNKKNYKLFKMNMIICNKRNSKLFKKSKIGIINYKN